MRSGSCLLCSSMYL